MSNRIYQQCTRCVMDTTDPDITFDGIGHCNHCIKFLEDTAHCSYRGEVSKKELDAAIIKIKRAGRGREYDCIMGISGGIDSCYAAYVAKNLGLRVLAVHMDNGWNSDTAVKNIISVAKKLGIDYQSYVLDWEEFKDLQLAFLKASVPEIETPTDIAIPAALHEVAAKHRVKYIISGGNYATEGILPAYWHYNAKDVKFLRAVHKRFGTRKLKSFPTFGYVAESWYKLARGIRMFYLLNYVPYSKDEAMQLLQEKLGWKYYGGKHYESKITGFLHSYVLPEKFGIDYRKATLSTQICAGSMTRDAAIEELKAPPYDPVRVADEKVYIAKKFGISMAEFEEILARPPKSHRDYPNDQKRLEFFYSTYRKYLAK